MPSDVHGLLRAPVFNFQSKTLRMPASRLKTSLSLNCEFLWDGVWIYRVRRATLRLSEGG